MAQVLMVQIGYKIEKRFYQVVLSTDLKWREQASASLTDYFYWNRYIAFHIQETVKYSNRHQNLATQTLMSRFLQKIREISSSLLSWLRFMRVGKI